MISRRLLGAGVVAASVASMIAVGSTALASSHVTGRNDRPSAGAPSRGWTQSAAPTKAKKKTYSYSLAASAFTPDNSSDNYSNEWDPSKLYESSGGCANAGLSVPGGATLKSVTVYYTSGSKGLTFQFNRQDLLNHTYVELASLTTGVTNSPTYTKATKKLNSTVNYAKYAYSFGVCPHTSGENPTFSGVTVTYTAR